MLVQQGPSWQCSLAGRVLHNIYLEVLNDAEAIYRCVHSRMPAERPDTIVDYIQQQGTNAGIASYILQRSRTLKSRAQLGLRRH